ncbi:hypothetical protein MKX01_009728 [Papaver californicum]|nr:hypothetical protein MKX01_009728 [Papaver californicum]
MAQIHKMGLEVAELKCSATKFYGYYKNNITQLVKFFPEICKSVQVTEVDGLRHTLEESTEAVNDEIKSITWNFYGGELMNYYKSFGFKLVSVTLKGEGCCSVKWSVEFEKANEDVLPPTAYINLLDKITRALPSRLL